MKSDVVRLLPCLLMKVQSLPVMVQSSSSYFPVTVTGPLNTNSIYSVSLSSPPVPYPQLMGTQFDRIREVSRLPSHISSDAMVCMICGIRYIFALNHAESVQ